MDIQLDFIETQTLRGVLENAWRDLRYEIADTDNPGFRAGLQEQERIMERILSKLGSTVVPLPIRNRPVG